VPIGASPLVAGCAATLEDAGTTAAARLPPRPLGELGSEHVVAIMAGTPDHAGATVEAADADGERAGLIVPGHR
jgi:hypothetical protein